MDKKSWILFLTKVVKSDALNGTTIEDTHLIYQLGNKSVVLPSSVENLENLETLQLERSPLCEIPAFIICKLRELRHLLGFKQETGAPFGSVGIKVVGGIGRFNALQKLYKIEADGEGVDGLFKELENLKQLKTWGISKLKRENGVRLCLCVEKMKLLESLNVTSTNENEVVDLECMSSPLVFLRCSTLEDDPLEVLEKMPNLSELTIGFDAYVGEQLHCNKSSSTSWN